MHSQSLTVSQQFSSSSENSFSNTLSTPPMQQFTQESRFNERASQPLSNLDVLTNELVFLDENEVHHSEEAENRN